jgi:hypothetical protein
VSDSVGLTDSDSVVVSSVLELAVSSVLEVTDGVGLAVSSVLEVADGERLPGCGVGAFGLTAPVWSVCSGLGEGTFAPVFFENFFPVVSSTTVNDLMAIGAGLMTMTFRASKPGQALPW